MLLRGQPGVLSAFEAWAKSCEVSGSNNQSVKNLLDHLVITPHILESLHFGHFFSKDSWFASLDHGFGHLLHMISVPLPESPLDHPENCVPWLMVSSPLAIFWNLSSNCTLITNTPFSQVG